MGARPTAFEIDRAIRATDGTAWLGHESSIRLANEVLGRVQVALAVMDAERAAIVEALVAAGCERKLAAADPAKALRDHFAELVRHAEAMHAAIRIVVFYYPPVHVRKEDAAVDGALAAADAYRAFKPPEPP